MKILDLRSYVCRTEEGRNFVFIFVETDDGITGVGECSQSNQDSAVVANLKVLRDQVLNRDPFDLIEILTEKLSSGRTGRAWAIAVSGIEMALWDIIGKSTGRPIFQFFGGAFNEQIECYATVAAGIDVSSHEEIIAESLRAAETGFRTLKFAPFGESRLSPIVNQRTGRDIDAGFELLETVRTKVREALGFSIDLAIECNFAFSESTAALVMNRSEDLNVLWLEAPLWWDDPDALLRLRSKGSVPIASGEMLHGKAAYRELIDKHAVDIVQPDVKWCGGCLETKKIAAWAEAHQIGVAPHNNSGPIATAASAQVAMSLPNIVMLEVSSKMAAWGSNAIRSPSLIVDGRVSASTLRERVGLGIDVDEEVISALSIFSERP